MSRRVLTLTGYLFRSLLFSLPGVLFLVVALVYWYYFFPPSQSTPDLGNYVLVTGAFGMAMAFLTTLTVASRANRAEHYPVLVRLASRPEYLTAVMLAALLMTFLLQALVAGLGLIRGPDLTAWTIVETIPLWVAPDIIVAVLALHASDLAYSGWSRVILFGIIAFFLLMSSVYEWAMTSLAGGLDTLGRGLIAGQTVTLGNWIIDGGTWLRSGGTETVGAIFQAPFWPFRAIIEGVSQGYFTPTQSLAPAILLLYATILYLIVADLFANKDLELTE